jgi:hypothetical protein
MIAISEHYISLAAFLLSLVVMLIILLILNVLAAHFGVKEVKVQIFREVKENKEPTTAPNTPPRRDNEVE